jgi:hypothetical protein
MAAMNVLILHRIPYYKINYHLAIDHQRHEVTYIGTAANLGTIPATLRCRKVERAGRDAAADEVSAWLETERQTFDRILSLSEYELLDAARLRARFCVPGPQPHQVEKVRNKVAMKQAVAAAGVRVPHFMSLADLVVAGGSTPWHGRTVLKPLDGASSEDVVIFPTPHHVVAAVAAGQTGVGRLDGKPPKVQGFEVEEFIEGPILHFDGLVKDGRLLAVLASRYIGTCLEYAWGHPLGSLQLPLADSRADWVAEILHAVGIDQGSFHLEAIQAEQGLVFLEIGNRVGGADVVDTFEMATGIHLPLEELKILLGEAAPPPAPIASTCRFGWFVFPGHHLGAKHCRLEGHEPFANSSMMVRWHQLSVDQPLPKSITYNALEVPAAGVVRASTSEVLASFLNEMFQTIRVLPVEMMEAVLA